MAAFDPKQFLITVRGGASYLPVAGRVAWFRSTHSRGMIDTRVVTFDAELAVVRCEVRGDDGTLLATAHGSAHNDGRAVWAGRHLEKAETAAIGRALALAGFGTQFTLGDFDDDDHLADTPNDPPQPAATTAPQRVVNAGELRRWFDEMVELYGATPELVRDALGVSSALEWTGTLDEATERIREYVNSREGSSGKEGDDAQQ